MRDLWNRAVIRAHRMYRITEVQIDQCQTKEVRDLLIKRLTRYRNIEFYAIERLNRQDNLDCTVIEVDFTLKKRIS